MEHLSSSLPKTKEVAMWIVLKTSDKTWGPSLNNLNKEKGNKIDYIICLGELVVLIFSKDAREHGGSSKIMRDGGTEFTPLQGYGKAGGAEGVTIQT